MNFKNWMENLTQDRTNIPNQKYKKIYVKDENNPQQINYWKRNNTHKVYKMSIFDDKFIHFSLTDNIQSILEKKEISGDWSIFAISLSYGTWVPGVQFNHIIRKKREKLLAPSDMKNKIKKERALKYGFKIPKLSEEINAVMFTTSQIPKQGHQEEVVWDGPLKLTNVQYLDSRTAINMLKHTKYKINPEDIVEYF